MKTSMFRENIKEDDYFKVDLTYIEEKNVMKHPWFWKTHKRMIILELMQNRVLKEKHIPKSEFGNEM